MTHAIIDPQVLFTPIDGREGILLHLESQRYYSLNETGCFIWNEISGGQRFEAIIAAMVHRFDVSPDRARLAFQSFTKMLEGEQLIRVAME